jgi:hypothetical protein
MDCFVAALLAMTAISIGHYPRKAETPTGPA